MLNLLFPIFNVLCVVVFIGMTLKYWNKYHILRNLFDESIQLTERTRKANLEALDACKGNSKNIDQLKKDVAYLNKMSKKPFKKG